MSSVLLVSGSQQIHFNLPRNTFFLIWFAFLGLFVLVIYAKVRDGRKRTEKMQQLAMEMGFNFFAKADDPTATELEGIQTSTAGDTSARLFRNILKGSFRGGVAVIADCSVRSGNSSSSHTIAAFKFADPLPPFSIFPEHKIFKWLEKLGLTDIDLPEAPEFSRRFFLQTKNEAAVRELFKPAVTQAFESSTDPALCATSSGNWLTFYHPTGIISPEKLREFRQQTEAIANAFAQGHAFTTHF
jgi:hypothetical protein